MTKRIKRDLSPSYRKDAIKAAKDLRYGPKVVEAIENAESDIKITRIMAKARVDSLDKFD